MALASTTVWEVDAATGNDLYGGGFDAVLGAAGTDYTYGGGQAVRSWLAAAGTHTNDLTAASEKAANQVEAVSEALRQRSAEMDDVAERTATRLVETGEQFRERLKELTQESRGAVDGLETGAGTIERRVQDVSTKAEEAEVRLRSVSDLLARRSGGEPT